ncbi:MAG TPA: Ig-like domain repeat protein [Pyrinomonadaceae bacterium]|jgi:hypothetical protein
MKTLLKPRRFLLLSLVTLGCLTAALVATKTRAAKTQARATVRAAVQRPFLNLRASYALSGDEQGGVGVALTSGARPLALATADYDTDGAPDLLSGYATDAGGVVTLRRGNLDAFAPRDPQVFAAIQQGQLPDSFLPTVRAFAVPEAPDFLLAGDFNRDSFTDVLAGARGGGLCLFTGDGAGNLAAARQVKLPGALTALAAGGSVRGEGLNDVAVGVSGGAGPEALVFVGGVNSKPLHFALPAEATSFAFGNMDKDGYNDLAIAAGAEVDIVHGWADIQAASKHATKLRAATVAPALVTDTQTRIERVALPFTARALAAGYFVWNREQFKSLAVQAEDGALYLVQRAALDRRPFTAEEMYERTHGDQEVFAAMQVGKVTQPATWQPGADAGWELGGQLGVSAATTAGVAPQTPLAASFLTYQETADLLVVSPGRNQVNVLRHLDQQLEAAKTGQAAAFATQQSVALDVAATPVAFLEMPRKVNGERDLVMLETGSVAPMVVPAAPLATITVDRTDDVAAASACTGSANDCSLRGAVAFANANAGTLINVPANTYNITLSGAEDVNATGDLDLLPGASGVAFVGAGAPTTIIQVNQASAPNERIFQVTPGTTPTVGWTGTWSGLTMQNGGSPTSILSGGAILMGGTDNVYNLFSCTFNNNDAGGNIGGNGGAVSQSAKQNGGHGQATFTNCTFTNNAVAQGVGGAIRTLGGTTSQGTESTTITGGVFDNNQATINAGGAIFLTSGLATYTISKAQFTNNKAYTTGAPSTDNGGGGIQKSNGALTVSFCRFRGNVVGTALQPGSGEGVQLGGNGDLNATNNWWGCNVDPQSAGANTAGCDTAFKVSSVTGTLTTLPQLVLKNTANPAPIVTGQDTTLTASVNTNSANQDVSQNVIALLDLAVTWGNPVRGALSNQQNILQSSTATIAASPSGATETGTTVTITTTAAHGFTTGRTVIISGVGDTRYTGTYTILSVPTTTTFTVTNPITGLPASGGGTVKTNLGTATANFRAALAGAGSADATVDSAVGTANFTINKADTTTTITADTPDPTVSGQSFTVNYSLSVNAPGSNVPTVPTGNVTVTADTGEQCTGTINAATPATGSCSITVYHAGNRTLTATYAGDANFNTSTSSPATAHLVNKADTTTAITSDNPDPSVTNQSVTVAYSVSVVLPGTANPGPTPDPNGNVVVTDNGNTFCTGTVAAGQCSAPLPSAGAHSLVAAYQGDANYNASPASTAAGHTVNKADTTVTIQSDTPDPSTRGQSFVVTYSLAVTSPGSNSPTAPTGNVTVSDGVDSCTGTLPATQCTLTLFTVGNRTITATYAGDGNFNASPASAGAAHTVNKINTTTVVTSSKNPSDVGNNVTFTATITPASGTDIPTGTVQFWDGPSGTGTPIGSPATVTNGVATVQTAALTPGTHTITADYSGDGNLNASSATLAGGQLVINPTPTAPGDILVTEFRFHGTGTPNGAQDEFIELYNNTGHAITVPASGYPLIAINPAGQTTLIYTVPANKTIPAHAHFLVTNQTTGVGFSLGNYPAGVSTTVGLGDGQYTNKDINDGGGIALFNTDALLDATSRLDAVGFSSVTDPLYRQGAGLLPAGGITADGQYSFVRKQTSGLPQNTSDNAADFDFVAGDAGTYSGVAAVRGGAGPESLASPIQRNAQIKAVLIDPQQSSLAAPNRVRDPTSGGAGTPTAFGTLEIRRKFTNTTGGPVTKLRFRVVDVTTTNSPNGPLADMRVLSSVNTNVTITGGGLVTVLGPTLETPPTQAQGGGLNSSVVVTLPGASLASGASVNVRFVLGVAQGGSYRFFINVEALP